MLLPGPARPASTPLTSRAQRSAASTASSVVRRRVRDARSSTPSMSAGMPSEVEPPVQERRHRHLVGGVERRRRRAPRLGRRARQPQGREPLEVRSLEIEPRRGHEVERFYTGADALRPAERVRDRACACPDCRAGPGSNRPRTPPSNARCSADVRPRRPCRGSMPNSTQASISSSPLFISVAESTEILRPMLQRGCAQAWSGRHARPSARAACAGTARPTR